VGGSFLVPNAEINPCWLLLIAYDYEKPATRPRLSQVITVPSLIGRIYADEVWRRDCPKNIVDMRSWPDPLKSVRPALRPETDRPDLARATIRSRNSGGYCLGIRLLR
jgi:hypothetical protein